MYNFVTSAALSTRLAIVDPEGFGASSQDLFISRCYVVASDNIFGPFVVPEELGGMHPKKVLTSWYSVMIGI